MTYLYIILMLLLPGVAWGHSGSVDSYGCHNNTALVKYECHTGTLAGKSWPNPGGKDAMLKELAAAPKPPVTLMGTGALTWAAPTDGVTTGYLLYWGLAPGQYQKPLDIGMRTSLEMTNLFRGATWYFSLKAYAANGKTSDFSNEVSKVIP
jgi:hypothetical protein